MKYEIVKTEKAFVVDIKVIPENDKDSLFLKKYTVAEQKELDELDILKFNDELVDFIEAKGYTTKAAFNLPIDNICSVKVN